ncbi:MAG: hypothetical protein JSV08_10090 [Acidobacteriota bacterium]|nr:MAG: hypothetical protein JSV08_10090 [Acidobacteriota bacterium]
MEQQKRKGSEEQMIEADFDQMEVLLKRIEVEYNVYFQGGRKRPPDDYMRTLKNLVRRYRNMTLRQYRHRFRFSTFISKFSIYEERWNRRLKEIEESVDRGITGAQRVTLESLGVKREVPQDLDEAEQAADVSPPPVPAERAPGADPMSHRISDLSEDRDAVEKLFKAYMAAKEKAGENVKKLRLASFKKVIAKQVKGFQAKGAEHVQFQIETKDGKVKLRAGRAK